MSKKKPSKRVKLHALDTSTLPYAEHIGGKAAVDLFIMKLSNAINAAARDYPYFARALFAGVQMTPKEKAALLGKARAGKKLLRDDGRVTFIGLLNDAIIRMRGNDTPRLGYYVVDGQPVPSVVAAIPMGASVTFDNGIVTPEVTKRTRCKCGCAGFKHDTDVPRTLSWTPAVVVPAKPKRKR